MSWVGSRGVGLVLMLSCALSMVACQDYEPDEAVWAMEASALLAGVEAGAAEVTVPLEAGRTYDVVVCSRDGRENLATGDLFAAGVLVFETHEIGFRGDIESAPTRGESVSSGRVDAYGVLRRFDAPVSGDYTLTIDELDFYAPRQGTVYLGVWEHDPVVDGVSNGELAMAVVGGILALLAALLAYLYFFGHRGGDPDEGHPSPWDDY